jgi:CRISPR system Cascade subunit CasE
MYLSRIAINKRLRKTKQALAFPQMMHAAVLGSFPPGAVSALHEPVSSDVFGAMDVGAGGANEGSGTGNVLLLNSSETHDAEGQKISETVIDLAQPTNTLDDGRVLWRTDTIGEQTWLYVLSAVRPDFAHIVEQFGWAGAEQGWDTKDYEPFLSHLNTGQRWRFRLHANPVYILEGKRLAHVTVERQIEWLTTRAERNGFSFYKIITPEGDADAVQIIHRNILKFRKRPSDKTSVTLSVVTYEGELIVEDAELLRRALTCGIGKAKAYGCGLLTLARIE